MTGPVPTPADLPRKRDAAAVVHQLKTTPGYFQQVWAGRKTFEVRYDDRGYQRGDRVLLREWDPYWPCSCSLVTTGSDQKHVDDRCEKYTGRQTAAEIGYVLAFTPARGHQRGFNGNGYVVFSLLHRENTTIDRRPAPTGDGTDTTITPSCPERDA